MLKSIGNHINVLPALGGKDRGFGVCQSSGAFIRRKLI
jgi:hypothetical protein